MGSTPIALTNAINLLSLKFCISGISCFLRTLWGPTKPKIDIHAAGKQKSEIQGKPSGLSLLNKEQFSRRAGGETAITAVRLLAVGCTALFWICSARNLAAPGDAVPFGTIGSTSMGRGSRKLARSPELTNDHLSTIGKIVEIVRPLLHHAPPRGSHGKWRGRENPSDTSRTASCCST
jgi:hypothetical protein